jgi:hypothetical protein
VAQAEGGPGTVLPRSMAPVAQMDRAGGFYPSGCGFDSCRGHQTLANVVSVVSHHHLQGVTSGCSWRRAM